MHSHYVINIDRVTLIEGIKLQLFQTFNAMIITKQSIIKLYLRYD